MKWTIFALGLVALLCPRGARAQSPGGEYPGTAMPPTNVSVPLSSHDSQSPTLSRWIVGTDPDCCSELSDRNPMRTELYFRAGYSLPSGDGIVAESITEGLAVQGGFRSLFFNRRGDAAWTLELGLTNLNNPASSSPRTALLHDLPFTFFNAEGQQVQVNDDNGNPVQRLNEPNSTAQIGALNRTFVNLGAGREWYMLGAAAGTRNTPDPARWRVGIDGGGRWGTSKLQLRNFRPEPDVPRTQVNFPFDPAVSVPVKNHLTDTIGGVYASLHSDLDIPCGCCVFQIGIRAEWDYTWSDILQIQNKSDVQDINLMVNLGVRY